MKKLTKSKKYSSYGNPRQAALDWYFAGIIDGEGTIGLQKSKTKSNPIYRPTISVGMVNKHIIDLLQGQYGGYTYSERVPRGKNRQPMHRWKLHNAKGLQEFIDKVSGKLLEKQEQLNGIKDFLDNKIDNPNHKRYLHPKELQRREGLYMKMKELNAVGAAATTKRFDNREIEAIV